MGTRDAHETFLAPVVVVGSGVAGMVAALAAAPTPVVLVTRTAGLPGGSSRLAQGGVAVAFASGDSPEAHARDTVAAAAGLADPAAVRVLTGEGPEALRWLLGLGARFDRNADGSLARGREGAHGTARVIHASGDATGAEMVRALARAVVAAEHVHVLPGLLVTGLVAGDGGVEGVAAVDREGRRVLLRSRAVVLATGGVGRLFARTTNPPEAGAGGLWLAARAGAVLADLEMVQFHPTALAAGADPLPLLTEALRGEGAVLLDGEGERFMVGEHPRAELAPRDVVARAIWRRLHAGDRVVLDATVLGGALAERFPTVLELALRCGLDPRREPLPVTPAAHYHMGGVVTDLEGRTAVPGLWAAGEVACTGVHGANRLASNSLLEALVFGRRTGESAAAASGGRVPAAGAVDWPRGNPWLEAAGPEARAVVAGARELLWEGAGVVRDRAGLERCVAGLGEILEGLSHGPWEARARVEVSLLLARAALARDHSLGAHFRQDRPGRPVGAPHHLLLEGERFRWGRLGTAGPDEHREVAP